MKVRPDPSLSVYLWRLGAHIQAIAQFPLPGTRVIRDTVIVRGDVARRRGKLLQRIGAVLLLSALGMFAAWWRLYALFPAHTT